MALLPTSAMCRSSKTDKTCLPTRKVKSEHSLSFSLSDKKWFFLSPSTQPYTYLYHALTFLSGKLKRNRLKRGSTLSRQQEKQPALILLPKNSRQVRKTNKQCFSSHFWRCILFEQLEPEPCQQGRSAFFGKHVLYKLIFVEICQFTGICESVISSNFSPILYAQLSTKLCIPSVGMLYFCDSWLWFGTYDLFFFPIEWGKHHIVVILSQGFKTFYVFSLPSCTSAITWKRFC